MIPIDERIIIWILGFVAGLTFGGIVFGDGGGGWDIPRPEIPPRVPDFVPKEWLKDAHRD